jgi:ABC-type molybdenum transport system ATPase subunit/photorepair protein PhrA
MNDLSPATAISPLRQRLIDDMNVRRFSRETQRNHIRDVGRFATFLRRSPDTATAEDVRNAPSRTSSHGCGRRTGSSTPNHLSAGQRRCSLICRATRTASPSRTAG